MRNEQYNIEDSIEKCLEKHPGASAKKIFRFCKSTVGEIPAEEAAQAAVYSKLRKMKRKRKVINKADCWFLLMKKKGN